MKVYSDTLTQADLREALPKGVTLAVLEIIPNTRKRRNGWIVSLSGSSPYRSQVSASGHRAATWDEHGLWMAELYRRDPNAVVGWYKTRDQFIRDTVAERDRVRKHFGDRTGHERNYRDSHKAPWLVAAGKTGEDPFYFLSTDEAAEWIDAQREHDAAAVDRGDYYLDAFDPEGT